jgi:hypothetical protein
MPNANAPAKMVVTYTPITTKVVSKNEALRSKSPTIALEDGVVECVGKLGRIK